MKNIYVSDVGDGLCMELRVMSNETIQIDWGSQQGGRFAFIKGNNINPDVFILSHFHADHYNGLLYASTKSNNIKWKVKKVYYPRLPYFQKNQDFFLYLLTMNLRILGEETGIMEYDFLQTIAKINSIDFEYTPVSQGDIIDINGTYFEVLWPPKKINDKNSLKIIKKAIIDFEEALKKDKKTKEIYDYIKNNKEKIFRTYFSNDVEKIKTKHTIKNHKECNELKLNKTDKIPKVVKEANYSLRRAANHLSLAFYESNNFLFLGDTENFEIKQIINYLLNRNCNEFYVLITPHHGTHWNKELYNIKCSCSISSNGKNLFSKMRTNFEEISAINLSTHIYGDINVNISPNYLSCYCLK
jgi:ribonuclease BN (tRNA processing enzyme)